jgi:hypothetical protein
MRHHSQRGTVCAGLRNQRVHDLGDGLAAIYPDRARQPCSGLSQIAIHPNLGMIEAKMTSFRKSFGK